MPRVQHGPIRHRLRDRGYGIYLTKFNYQRLVLTAVMIASKMFDDESVANRQWALAGDLSVTKLNRLELDLLFALQFECNITREEYELSRRLLQDQASKPLHPLQTVCK